MALTEEQRTIITIDHERAQTYGTKYLGRLNHELFARGLILTKAMDKFSGFLNLPATDRSASAIWDFAFSVLATAIPALRLNVFIKKLEIGSSVALAMAEATGKKARLAKTANTVARVARVGGNTAEKINNAKDTYEKISGNYGKAFEESEPNQLANLDASRKPIADLIEDSKNAAAAWEKALDAELQEYENRLNGLKPTDGIPATLEAHIKNLLPPPPTFSNEELVELENLYLWHLTGAYVKQSVQIIKTTVITQIISATTHKLVNHPPTNSINGLNNTQQKAILELFGPKEKRGKYFLNPPPKDIYAFLNHHGVKTVPITKHETMMTPSARM